MGNALKNVRTIRELGVDTTYKYYIEKENRWRTGPIVLVRFIESQMKDYNVKIEPTLMKDLCYVNGQPVIEYNDMTNTYRIERKAFRSALESKALTTR